MKKLKLMLGALSMGSLLFIGNQASAQKSDNSFEEGSVTLNLGVGLGRSTYGSYGYYGSGYYGYGTAFGTKVAIERGMWQLGPGVLSLGVEAGASFSSAHDGYKSNIIIVAARSAYHFGWNVDKLDTYGGVSLGPGFRKNDYSDINGSKYSKNDVIVSPGVFVGGSYFFSPNIGVNVEVGYDITVIQGGLIFKLK